DYPHVNPERIVTAFSEYMSRDGHRVTRAQFEKNIAGKLSDPEFAADVGRVLHGRAGDNDPDCHFKGSPEFEQFCIAGFPASTQVAIKSGASADSATPRWAGSGASRGSRRSSP